VTAKYKTYYGALQTCNSSTNSRGTLGVGKTIMAGYFIEVPLSKFCCRILLLSKGGSRVSLKPEILFAHSPINAFRITLMYGMLSILCSKNLQIDDNVGVGLLFDKVLRDPLNRTKTDVFIVLNGLDEGDRTTIHTVDCPPRTEMEILLEHLSTLKSARLLLISRPEANIKRVIPSYALKPLGKDDDEDDIDTYVK